MSNTKGKRITLELEPEVAEWLLAEAAKLGVSIDEIVNGLIDDKRLIEKKDERR